MYSIWLFHGLALAENGLYTVLCLLYWGVLCMGRITFIVKRVEKYEKRIRREDGTEDVYTYFRINIPQKVVKKYIDLLMKWTRGESRLVVTIEEAEGE